MNESQSSISQWAAETFGPVSSNVRVASRANEEMAELLRALASDDEHPKAAEEVADVAIVLFRLSERLGSDLFEEIDRKMQINRARKWNLSGDGHGYHVRDQVIDATINATAEMIRIEIATKYGKSSVLAFKFGAWAAHRTVGGCSLALAFEPWSVTHETTGLCLPLDITQDQAIAIAEALGADGVDPVVLPDTRKIAPEAGERIRAIIRRAAPDVPVIPGTGGDE